MNECEHLAQLRRYLAENGLRVWGERCKVTHESVLKAVEESA